jgi:hypothetical protein
LGLRLVLRVTLPIANENERASLSSSFFLKVAIATHQQEQKQKPVRGLWARRSKPKT